MVDHPLDRKNLPQNFHHIRLELAREEGRPGGDAEHGYDIVAPLTPDRHIDATSAYLEHKQACRVRRFRPGEPDAIGLLRHGPGGRWYIDYDEDRSTDDESGFRFGDERFELGEYVSIREDDGVMHTFKVTRVETL